MPKANGGKAFKFGSESCLSAEMVGKKSGKATLPCSLVVAMPEQNSIVDRRSAVEWSYAFLCQQDAGSTEWRETKTKAYETCAWIVDDLFRRSKKQRAARVMAEAKSTEPTTAGTTTTGFSRISSTPLLVIKPLAPEVPAQAELLICRVEGNLSGVLQMKDRSK